MVGVSCNPNFKHCRKNTATTISASVSRKKVKECQFIDNEIFLKCSWQSKF